MSLHDARAKLGRAELHIEALRADIREVGQGEPYTIPLREELDEKSGNLYIRIDRIPICPKEWGLLIGDAVHNLRSALDNGWWQLACAHFGREPTDQEGAKRIQFPIIAPDGTWDPGNYVQSVGEGAVTFAGELQPDHRRYGATAKDHPLALLRRLSNVDKHRNINPTVLTAGPGEMTITKASGFTKPLNADASDFQVHHLGIPQVDDKVITIPVGSVLRDPDVQFEAKQTGFIVVDGGLNLLKVLTPMRDVTYVALKGFKELLAGGALEVRIEPITEPDKP